MYGLYAHPDALTSAILDKFSIEHNQLDQLHKDMAKQTISSDDVSQPQAGVPAYMGNILKAVQASQEFYSNATALQFEPPYPNLQKYIDSINNSTKWTGIHGLTGLAGIGSVSSTKSIELQDEISAIRKQVHESATQLENLSATNKKKDKKIDLLEGQLENLEQKEALAFLLGSVTELAHEVLFNAESIKNEFFDHGEKQAFVVSVDIRRSTELMLKARSSVAFSTFITKLCDELIAIFKRNFGVVDKFTGDGILVFFPEFFSGDDAGYFALKACSEAIAAFEKCYRDFRSSFTTVLKDVGVGMGVDYGSVHLLKMAGSLTVIGQPVVYACRLGGAPAGHIYFNQPAYEKISESYSHVTHSVETELQLKHEGPVLCYDINICSDKYQPKLPKWLCPNEQTIVSPSENT